MPVYVFKHDVCGKVREVERPMAESAEPLECDRCYKRGYDYEQTVMRRIYTPQGFIVRPSGYRLKPGDERYGDFNRELELGEVRTVSPDSHRTFVSVPDPEPEIPDIRLPERTMAELHAFGRIFDQAIRDNGTITETWGEA